MKNYCTKSKSTYNLNQLQLVELGNVKKQSVTTWMLLLNFRQIDIQYFGKIYRSIVNLRNQNSSLCHSLIKK